MDIHYGKIDLSVFLVRQSALSSGEADVSESQPSDTVGVDMVIMQQTIPGAGYEDLEKDLSISQSVLETKNGPRGWSSEQANVAH